jgi:predicted N-acetyltransferase YhbS
MTAMEVRLIRDEQCAQLGEITVRAYRRLVGDVPFGPYEEELRDVATHAAQCEVLVAIDEGTLLGGVTFVPSPGTAQSEFDDPDAAGIRHLAVDPSYQGRGAGTALVDACLDRARALGRRRVVLHSTPMMEVARAMYARRGFVADPTRDFRATDAPYSEEKPLLIMAFVLELDTTSIEK